MEKAFVLKAQTVGLAAARTLAPLLTQQLFYGAAVSCAVGLGLGLWLEPPRAEVLQPGSMDSSMIQLPPNPTYPDSLAPTPMPAFYSWTQPQTEPAVEAGERTDAVYEPVAQSEPPIQLAEADPADRARETGASGPPLDLDSPPEAADEAQSLPEPPRWEPHFPSRDGGAESWTRAED